MAASSMSADKGTLALRLCLCVCVYIFMFSLIFSYSVLFTNKKLDRALSASAYATLVGIIVEIDNIKLRPIVNYL